MKQQTKKQVKGVAAVAIAGLFFVSACATTSYVPRKSGMIKIMPKGYQKDDELFKRGIAKGGLKKAVQSNDEALKYARRSSRNVKWGLGLLWGGLATFIGGASIYDSDQPRTRQRNVAGTSLLWTGIGSMLLSIFPYTKSFAQESDAINKYNDDVLERLAPQVFNEPTPKEKSGKPESQWEKKAGSAVITVPQEGERTSE